MRGNQVVSEDKALWDPLWEYILDDHDSEEESLPTRRFIRSRSTSRRQKDKGNETSLFDLFFDNESEYSEDTRYDHRDEKSSKAKETAKSRRRSQLTEDAGVDNSLWDFFSKDKKTTSENKQKNLSTTSSKTETRASIQSEVVSEKGTKRVGLFSRFRKNKEIGARRALSADDAKKKVRVTVTQVPSSTRQGSVIKKTPSRREGSMDPFQMILEVAGKLDPFGSDSDSDETATRDDTLDVYDLTVSGAEMDRLVDEVRSGTPKNEIVLNFRPTVQPTGSETDAGNAGQSSEVDLQIPSGFDENSMEASGYRSTSREVETTSEMDSILDDSPDDPLQDSSNPRFRTFPTDNLDRSQPHDGPPSISILGSEKDGERQRNGLRRLACCVVARNTKHTTRALPTEMPLHAVESTHSRPNDAPETSNNGYTNVNPVDSLPRDPSTQTTTLTGPQPYYAYDDSEEHMDVFYTSMGLKPRSSIAVRKLGNPPPLLSSSMRDEVIIQVDASTVSETDCIIRQGFWWGPERPPLANTPGVDVVGKVFQVKPNVGIEFGLQPAQPVLSLIKWGGNSRFAAIEPNKLVKIPYDVNPTEAACLPETYLTAFQVLHLGQSVKVRYDKSSLRGKSILIVGSMANNMGKAIIELALHGGVANIYATAKQKHWKTLISFGVMPLSPEPNDWITRLEGTIDLVLASNGGLREDITPIHFRALRPKTGRLIMCGRRVVGNDVPVGDSEQTSLTLACAKQKAATRMMNCSYAYNVYDHWERNLDLCKRDLKHLLTLLQHGVIQPKILDRIPLDKVMRAHEMLESKRLSGFLICEPWMKSKKRALYL